MGTENGNGVHTCGWVISHENPFHQQPDECVSACGLDGTGVAAPAYHVLTLLAAPGSSGSPRATAHNDNANFGRILDHILFYIAAAAVVRIHFNRL